MQPARARRGFTLLELVVVLAILATLAGLVISQVAMFGRSTDMAASAKTQADIANNLQMFFVLQKRFPQYMDSLLLSDGAAPTGVYGPVNDPVTGQQVRGLPASSPALHADLTLGTLTANQRRSFTRCGFDVVMDHSASVVNSNDSGTLQRTLPSSGTMQAAVITPGSPAAMKVYPGTNGLMPAGVQLVALGVGPRSSCIPKTMLNAPIYPGCDGAYYGRYVAIFAVYETGERATLVGVCDSYGRFPDYTIQQYNESLPNDSRQG
jgi:prepilin-type N-terminal cleavage/methylation domain-containing protein